MSVSYETQWYVYPFSSNNKKGIVVENCWTTWFFKNLIQFSWMISAVFASSTGYKISWTVEMKEIDKLFVGNFFFPVFTGQWFQCVVVETI